MTQALYFVKVARDYNRNYDKVKFIRKRTMMKVLKQYQYKEIKKYVQTLGYNTSADVADLTETAKVMADERKEMYWAPFVLLAAILFPIWSEVVAVIYSNSFPKGEGEFIGSVILMMFSGFVLFLHINILKNMLLTGYGYKSEVIGYLRILALSLKNQKP